MPTRTGQAGRVGRQNEPRLLLGCDPGFFLFSLFAVLSTAKRMRCYSDATTTTTLLLLLYSDVIGDVFAVGIIGAVLIIGVVCMHSVQGRAAAQTPAGQAAMPHPSSLHQPSACCPPFLQDGVVFQAIGGSLPCR